MAEPTPPPQSASDQPDEATDDSPPAARPAPTERGAPPPAASLIWLQPLSLALLAIAAFCPVLSNGFLLGNELYPPGEPTAPAPDTWRHAESLLTAGHHGRLGHLFLRVEGRLLGDRAAAWHLLSLLLHAANAVLLWLLLHCLRVRAAWFAAALYAVHPLHAQAIALISEQPRLLAAAAALLGALGWVRFAARPRWPLYAGALALLAIALAIHASVWPVPFVLAVLALWRRERWSVLPLGRYHLLLAPAMLLAAWVALADAAPVQEHLVSIAHVSPPERLLIAARAVGLHALHVVWPAGLAAFYPQWTVALTPPNLIPIGLLILAFVVLLVLRLAGRAGNEPLAALATYLLLLAPALGLFDRSILRDAYVADRFQYLAAAVPLAALAAILAGLFARLPASLRDVRRAGAVTLLVLLAVISLRQLGPYRDPDPLLRHSLARHPESAAAHTLLATHLRDRQQLDAAAAEYARAVDLRPRDARLRNALGATLMVLKRNEEAERELREALRLDPGSTPAATNLGLLLIGLGQFAEAEQLLIRTLAVKPDDVQLHRALSDLLLAQQRFSEAEDHLRRILDLAPEQPQAHAVLGDLLVQLNRPDEAIARYEAALKLEPRLIDARFNLANLLAEQGRFDEAIGHYRNVLELQPDAGAVHLNLATALELTGARQQALEHYAEVQRLAPDLITPAIRRRIQSLY
ncbi:MAG TPA: tetratricopeptide repeat protein [Candidatus Sumerlaeota bacterium]|nr:tetratricopeptide repeat protein [Candidatus Sumerlaeota bacterium]